MKVPPWELRGNLVMLPRLSCPSGTILRPTEHTHDEQVPARREYGWEKLLGHFGVPGEQDLQALGFGSEFSFCAEGLVRDPVELVVRLDERGVHG